MLGARENEFVADTHGIPFIYSGHRATVSESHKVLYDYEKKVKKGIV